MHKLFQILYVLHKEKLRIVINKKNNIEIFINTIIRKYNIIYTYQGQKIK